MSDSKNSLTVNPEATDDNSVALGKDYWALQSSKWVHSLSYLYEKYSITKDQLLDVVRANVTFSDNTNPCPECGKTHIYRSRHEYMQNTYFSLFIHTHFPEANESNGTLRYLLKNEQYYCAKHGDLKRDKLIKEKVSKKRKKENFVKKCFKVLDKQLLNQGYSIANYKAGDYSKYQLGILYDVTRGEHEFLDEYAIFIVFHQYWLLDQNNEWAFRVDDIAANFNLSIGELEEILKNHAPEIINYSTKTMITSREEYFRGDSNTPSQNTINPSLKPYQVLLHDKTLSFEARGLLMFLYSLENCDDINIDSLMNTSPAGKTKTARIVNEAIDKGYLVRHQTHEESGQFSSGQYYLEKEKLK